MLLRVACPAQRDEVVERVRSSSGERVTVMNFERVRGGLGESGPMADLYSLMHREAGPLATFTTPAEAEALVDKIGEAT